MTIKEKRRALTAVINYLVPDKYELDILSSHPEGDFACEVFNLVHDLSDRELEMAFPMLRSVLLGYLLQGKDGLL